MSNFKNCIEGIIFDLDGTLYKMEWYMKPLITIYTFPNIFLISKYMHLRKEFAGKDMGNKDKLVEAMLSKLGVPGNTARNWLYKKFYPGFINSLRFMKKSRPGLNALLKELKSRNIKLAVLSDFGFIEERLQALNIDAAVFNSIKSAENEGVLKPGIRPFKKIAEEFSILCENILVVGDRDDTDGVAAAESGMNFLKISDRSESHNWNYVKKILSTLPTIK